MTEQSTQQKEFTPDDDTVHVDVGEDEGYRYSGARAKVGYVADQMRTMAREMVDGMLRCLPEEVVEHVNNSRKEMLLAFRSLIDKELGSIDKSTQRVHDLHKPKEEKAEAAKE